MNANAAEENRPAIQQDFRPPGFNRAESNLILHLIRLRFDQHIVEFGTVRRPQRQIGIESNLHQPVRIRSKGLANPSFRNSYPYFLIELISIQFHPAADPLSRALLQLNEIVLDKSSWRLNQLHLASQSAIVPPIRDQCRNRVAPPLIVHFNNQEIASVSNEFGYFKIERRESALVSPNLLAVEINIRDVVCRAKVNKEPSVLFSLIIKRFLVPDGAFVEQQALCLSIPISWHL